MSAPKQEQEKSRLHPRNRNRERYDLDALIKSTPDLAGHLKPNKYGEDSVDFSNPAAVKLLNQALLRHYYSIDYWDFPNENLCPPIPGRADYIHYIADLLADSNSDKLPKGETTSILDIGVGASCIYPLIGITEYQWNFVGTDIDPKALESAQKIIAENPALHTKIELRLQEKPGDIFHGIINRGERFDAVICNPPFHASAEEADKETRRKVRNLSGKKVEKPKLNFSGKKGELVTEGGEQTFIQNIIRSSKYFSKNCFWFSTLVSKQSNLRGLYRSLEKSKVSKVKTIKLGTGNKSTRIVAWTFLNKTEQYQWHKIK